DRRPPHRPRAPRRRARRDAGAADLRRVRAPAHARRAPGPRLYPRDDARRALGRPRLPRAADDRRSRQAPAREARAGSAGTALHPDGARRRVPLPRPVNPLRSVGARLSLALLVVVAGALGLVYAMVVPSLEDRLVQAKLSELKRAAPVLAREAPSDRFGGT